MDEDLRRTRLRDGMAVHGADGRYLGRVVSVWERYCTIEAGAFWWPYDLHIPAAAFAHLDPDTATLTVSKVAAEQQGWGRPPPEDKQQGRPG